MKIQLKPPHLIFSLLAFLLTLAIPARAQTWSNLTSLPPGELWTGAACSADGSRLFAVTYEDGIWVSTNRGANWNQTSTEATNRWTAVASSADGSIAAAAITDLYGAVYTSTNSGGSWQPTMAPTDSYSKVAVSANGSTMVAVSTDFIYVSTNAGVNWAQNPFNLTTEAFQQYYGFNSVTVSGDGTKMAVAAGGTDGYGGSSNLTWRGAGAIFYSTNSGSNWLQSDAPTNWVWESVACSSNGNFMVAAAEAGEFTGNPGLVSAGVVYLSTNAGVNWTPTLAPSSSYHAAACSGDGSKITVGSLPLTPEVGNANGVYESTNSGATWTQNPDLAGTESIAYSADGTKRVAAVLGANTSGVAVSPPSSGGGGGGGGGTTGITTSGNGSVTSNIGKNTKPGAKVTLTAKPAQGWLFENWTGAESTNKNPLTIAYATNLAIQANFVTNPFPSLAATYTGLFDPVGLFLSAEKRARPAARPDSPGTSQITAVNSGMLKNLVVASNGAYSGSLLYQGLTLPVTGAFDPASQTSSNLLKVPAAKGGDITLTMLITNNGFASLTGSVSQATWQSLLSAFPATNNGPGGQYTWFIPPDTNNNPPVSSPGGTGFLLVATSTGSAKKATSATITGVMADGVEFFETTPVGANGMTAVYAPLLGNKGLFLGWISIDGTEVSSFYTAWIVGPKADLYRAGFTNNAGAYGSPIPAGPWTNSAANFDAFTKLVINGVTNNVTISASGNIKGAGISGAVKPKQGLWIVNYDLSQGRGSAAGAIISGATNTALGLAVSSPANQAQSLPAMLLP